ncbi:MAG: hypothetical protein J0I65_11130 [Variovorax sp.]|nr:hypothetical protein [Variovorax sp.]
MKSSVVPVFRPEARGASAITWIICFLLAHHFAVFVHEYAHSFAAFALGYKGNPFQIHLGGTGPLNLLLLGGIDEHVDYQNMFNHGAGWAAAIVGLAGPALGNGITYFASLALVDSEAAKRHDWCALFAFALNVMSVGNFFAYVPIRTFVAHGDIAHITLGFGISPWIALIVLGIPTLSYMGWLFLSTMPKTVEHLRIGCSNRQRALVTVTVSIIFGFFGLAGWANYGTISHVLSCVSASIGAIALVFIWIRSFVRRSSTPEES